jgi:hypothetical protein
MIALLPFFPLAGLAWLAALPVILATATPEGLDGLIAGWAFAGLSGASSFGLLALARRKALSAQLKNVFGGFAFRMLIVVAGVLTTRRLGYGVGWFCLSFFALYWLFFALEVLVLQQGRRKLGLTEATP